jgi:hypothetical protein
MNDVNIKKNVYHDKNLTIHALVVNFYFQTNIHLN